MKKMSLRKCLSRTAAVLASLMVLLYASGITAFAYGRIDTGEETSLELTFTTGNTGIEGASFRLYQVADVSDAVVFNLTEKFEDAPVSLDAVESAGDWTDVAKTLADYVSAGSDIVADKNGTTDKNGSITFSELKVGLYLLVGDAIVVGNYSYTPVPVIIMLPTLREDDTWNYAPAAEAKYTSKALPVDPGVDPSDPDPADSAPSDPDPVDLVPVATAPTATAPVKIVPIVPVPTDTLPQTGTLNWPIPVLTISGLLLAGLGWYLFNRKKEN